MLVLICKRIFRKKYQALILFTTCLLCIYFCVHFISQSESLKMTFKPKSQMIEIRGTNPTGVVINQSETDYVFIFPRYLNGSVHSVTGEENNPFTHGVQHLSQLLDGLSTDFSGATCHGTSKIRNQNHLDRTITCQFQIIESSIIMSGGEYQKTTIVGKTYNLAVCNMVEVPFLIRRAVLNKLGLRRSLGEVTVMDFFLRTKGKLKIAASKDCEFLNEQLILDRGAMINKQVFFDYGLLGYHHNILRIVRQDTAIWTMCSRSPTFCPDTPSQLRKDTDIPCCHERLDQCLRDVVDGLKKVGIDYRICYGTHLGAYRTKTIIPWTYDVDICLKTNDYTNKQLFGEFKRVMKEKGYSNPFIPEVRRVLPLFPLTKKISNSSLLFNDKLADVMKDMLPVGMPSYQSTGYVDLYGYDKVFKGEPGQFLINGKHYLAYNDSNNILTFWYGESYNSKLTGRGSIYEPLLPLDEKPASTTQEDGDT